MSKPVLTFVKMMGCGPCNNFFSNPDTEKSQWAQLVKDKELAKIVEFSLAEWGQDRQTGTQFKKPTHLGFVNYGPAFVLVDSVNKETHIEYDKNLPKTASGIKKWILENHKKLKSSRTAAPIPTPTVLPVTKPLTQPIQATRTPGQPVNAGTPRAFVSQDKLPQQLRNKVTPNPQVPSPQIQISAPKVVPKVATGLRIVPRNAKVSGRRR